MLTNLAGNAQTNWSTGSSILFHQPGETITCRVPPALVHRTIYFGWMGTTATNARMNAGLGWQLQFVKTHQVVATADFNSPQVSALTVAGKYQTPSIAPYNGVWNGIRENGGEVMMFWPWGDDANVVAVTPTYWSQTCDEIRAVCKEWRNPSVPPPAAHGRACLAVRSNLLR